MWCAIVDVPPGGEGLCALRAYQVGLLVLLAGIWGASYLFIRVASPVFGPFVLIEGRVILAGAVLWIYAAITGQMPDLRTGWQRYPVLGALSGAIPFTLIAASELYLPASLAAILNATTPLFTAVVAAIALGERLTPARLCGLALGTIGVGVLVGWSPVPLNGGLVFGVVTSLIAALSYGLGGVYASRTFHGVPPLTMAIGQQAGAAVLLLPFAAVALPRAHFTAPAFLNFLGLALLSTAIAYLIYYPLIKQVGPTRTLSVTFLIPLFGLLWGALFLHEHIGPGTLIGLAIILSSITLIAGVRPRLVRRLPPAEQVS